MTENRPKRIQRKRPKGWRMPADAIYVGRPTKYGNYASRHSKGLWYWRGDDRQEDVERFRLELERWALDDPQGFAETLGELRGHDLACWCPLDVPCHADVWLELANVPKIEMPPTGIEELEHLANKHGWYFAVWLRPGGCIIQGSPDDRGDWCFDVQAVTVRGAIERMFAAVLEKMRVWN